MNELLKFRKFNELKNVYRMNSVSTRKESSAEHSWSCLMLADFFILKYGIKVDKLKVYDLLMYHDVVEIESGDTALNPCGKNDIISKQKLESDAATILKEYLPKVQMNKFYDLFVEFEEQKTIDAKFAKVVDNFDAIIHELDYINDWKGWSENFLRDKKEKYFIEFPEIKKDFNEILRYMVENNYFLKN